MLFAGGSGVTITESGVISINKHLIVDETSTLGGQVEIGGGYGHSGTTITADGCISVDNTSTLDGSVFFGGGYNSGQSAKFLSCPGPLSRLMLCHEWFSLPLASSVVWL